MLDLSKKSQAEAYFHSIMDDLQASTVKAVFALEPLSWSSHGGRRMYDVCSEVFVLLENGNCLVMDYRYIDSLDVQLRKMTAIEQDEYEKWQEKDYFNTVNDIYDLQENRVYQTETCHLEYGAIREVSLHTVTHEYEKWLDDGIDSVSPTEETFDEIRFTMSNGKSFVVCAGDAMSSGMTWLWSEDTMETVTKK